MIDDHHTIRKGGYILVANHSSPYDIPILWRHCHRRVDFVALEEIFRNPVLAALCKSMNSFPLDRASSDLIGVRSILHRLENGRVVGFFPEGAIRSDENALVNGGSIKPGLGRLAKLSRCPIIPTAIVNSIAYHSIAAWLPLRKTKYAIAFGPAIEQSSNPADTEAEVVRAMRELYKQLNCRLESSSRPPL